jgi:hypothetical protein
MDWTRDGQATLKDEAARELAKLTPAQSLARSEAPADDPKREKAPADDAKPSPPKKESKPPAPEGRPEPAKEDKLPPLKEKPKESAPPAGKNDPPPAKEEPRPKEPKKDPRPEEPIQVEFPRPPTLDPALEGAAQEEVVFKPRKETTDEDLRKQLSAVPELRLWSDEQVQAFQKEYIRAFREKTGTNAAPNLGGERSAYGVALHQKMLQAGAQAGLPLRRPRLDAVGAAVMEKLSTELRDLGFVSGFPSVVPRGSLDPPKENTPLNKVAELQRWCDQNRIEKYRGALPTLMQMLQVEKAPLRLLLVRELAKVKSPDATVALAFRALFDLDAEVRREAVLCLQRRLPRHYLPVLLQGLRYPWPPVADHAALALRKLRPDAAAQLVNLLDQPDPSAPALDAEKKKPVVRELVRLNHMRNCLLCHAPSVNEQDGLVRGLVPTPGLALPRLYYKGQSNSTFARADATFLRQDFSVIMTVKGAAP